jgi:hypothetical protein
MVAKCGTRANPTRDNHIKTEKKLNSLRESSRKCLPRLEMAANCFAAARCQTAKQFPLSIHLRFSLQAEVQDLG